MKDKAHAGLRSRREFISTAAKASVAASFAAGSMPVFAATKREEIIYPKGKAEHCIFIWLGGGAAQMDTWDPKRQGDFKKVPGSAYPAIDTAVPGVQVCEHLGGCAKILDRFVLLRSVHHDVIDEHAAATNRVHTGRPTSGTVVYPSIGSIVAHQRGAAADGIPPYVVIGYPNVTRGPGFLGAKHGYVYLTDTEAGPSGLTRPEFISAERAERREGLLAQLRKGQTARRGDDKALADYDTAIEESFKLSRGDFMKAFELGGEPDSLRAAYGSEFGQRCLLSRRLVQRGVRFIEVSFNLNFINGTGWDTHVGGQKNQHLLIQDLDRSVSNLVLDLEQHKLLDKTLIVIATEFGRPPEFDHGGGRGHQSKAFSIVLAGGGLKTGQVVGATDELSKKVVDSPMSIPDMHATIHCALGIHPEKFLYDEDRPVPITDRGQPARKLFA
jgi:hypothetical protein